MPKAEEETEHALFLKAQEKLWAPRRSTAQKSLDRFATLKPDDPRWTHKEAITCGDCYVFCQTDAYTIFPFSVKLQSKIPIRQEWWCVHVMHSAHMQPTSFKAYRHQGLWRYACSSWVLQRIRGVKFDFGVPPDKRPGDVVPFIAQRTEMVKYLGAILGVPPEKASELFCRWTGL